MKCAGVILDNSPHYLDHLGPLCALLGWPLIITEDAIAEQCSRFYPQVNLQQSDIPPCVVSCYCRPGLEELLGFSWKGRLIWLPHGLSDKGWKGPFFEALTREDLLLVYGQRMRDVLLAKGVSLPQASVGNFRLQFYQRHRSFYERLIEERFGNRRFFLYAPTWEDSEQNGTFWEAFPRFLDAVPPHLNLFIKLHPNTEIKFGHKLTFFRGLAESRSNIFFIDDFLPIYPLLSRADGYIGDMSSIGYDFLSMQKPLFFIRREKTDPASDPSAFLMQCGEQILLDEIPKLFERAVSYPGESIRKYSFDSLDWEEAAKGIQGHIGRWT